MQVFKMWLVTHKNIWILYRFIHSHNRAGNGFSLEVNHLADRSDLELRALRGKQYTSDSKSNGGDSFPYSQAKLQQVLTDIPATMDWRLAGAVTPVKGTYSLSVIPWPAIREGDTTGRT